MLTWFKRLTRQEKYLLMLLIFLFLMLILNWGRVRDGFVEGLEKFRIIEQKQK